MDLARRLLEADAAVLGVAWTFFGLTLDGSLELAQMVAARIYDTTRGTVTVKSMLREAAVQSGSFQRGDRSQVTEAITRSEKIIDVLEQLISSIRTRRNEWPAHLDPRTVADPKALQEKASLTVPDLQRVFAETKKILIEISGLYEGAVGELRFLGHDDYKAALDHIRQAKCSQIKIFENEFGPWDGPARKTVPDAAIGTP